jgi:hypothetical protein
MAAATTTISVHVKCANGKKHTVSIDPEGTVPDLKVSVCDLCDRVCV